MRTRHTLTAALALTLTLGTASAPALASTPAAPTATASTTSSEDWTDERSRALLERLQELAPAGSDRVDTLNRALGIDPQARAAQLERAIDGSQYECSDTELMGWLDGQLADWDLVDILILSLTGALDWPTYDALLFQPDGPQHYGVDGEHTKELEKTFRTLTAFWDVDGSDIRMGAMHGSVIQDDARMVRLLTFLYGYTPEEAQELTDLIQDYLQQDKFAGGDHPLFSFNAFAYSEEGAPPEAQLGIGDKIIMGDGILEGMGAIGLGDVAPRGILAHEYGHQVQFELGLFDDHAGDAEATRETELEADALAGYYLSHPRGERLRNQRVDAFVRSFGEVGDCSFASDGHHGTPNQRSASAAWADELANAKGAKGHVLPAGTVSDRFRAVLPEILAPDA
ncbi:hypothetical protein [Ornithinimicrobium pekingense]|uniref:Uncharacterized protein n=1 Tax=Ornithinimicrobium pekingense TaxID=384677 RepID=A0ABQ2F527_9MICO|nr:hypothetical protein [Ornithinimicrobium pekingense]GGK60106.1 hypothetical protein GCM10011509_05470 [Ornithinimicrobium pekingense]